MEGRAPFLLWKSAKQYDAAQNSLPGLVALLCLPSWAPFPSVTLRTLSGGFAGRLSLFPLWEAQHCGQDGRDFLVLLPLLLPLPLFPNAPSPVCVCVFYCILSWLLVLGWVGGALTQLTNNCATEEYPLEITDYPKLEARQRRAEP